jgi:anti-sigma-K factor RskA
MVDETQEDLETRAGEFVLGTLPEDERADARFRMRTDPDFKRAVDAWHRRLTPLLDGITPVEPAPGLQNKILERIIARREAPDGVIGLQRRLRRWQRFSLAATVIAGALIILLFGMLPREAVVRPEPDRYIAALQAGGQVPDLLVSVDLEQGAITVQRVGAQPRAGTSFELWAAEGGRDKPQSLGVIDATTKIPVLRLGSLTKANLENTVLAVSLEPVGGSPTGEPTGPIVFSGRLVPTP